MESEIVKEVEIPCAIIKLRKDGILHVHVTVKDDFQLENSKAILQARNQLTNNTACPHLYTGHNLINPSEEVTAFAASVERNELVLADAYVIHSLSQRIIGNFYIRFKKPVRPTRLFINKDKAIEWLSAYVQQT